MIQQRGSTSGNRSGRGKTMKAAVAAAAAGLLALGATASTARAQDGDDALREARFEVFALGQFSLSDEFDVGPIDVEYDDTFGGGIGVGFNPSDFVNINLSVIAGEATFVADAGFFGSVEDDSTFIAPEVNVDWNILDRDLTPFITGGVGAMIFTGGEVDETDFSYGGGAGVRWDFSETGFLKVWYRAKWFELDDADDEFLLHTFNIAIGWMPS